MATIDADLKAFIQSLAAVKKDVGARVYENHVPMTVTGEFNTISPFIYFVQTGEERADCLDDGVGTLPLKYQFSVEVVSKESISHARRIGANLVAGAHLYGGTFGARTVQRIFCEDQNDDYRERSGAPDRGWHTCSYNVEVVP